MVEIAILLGESLEFLLCERFIIFEDFFLRMLGTLKGAQRERVAFWNSGRISGENRFIMMLHNQ